MLWIIIAIIFAAGLLLAGLLLLWSPGKPRPILDENGKPLPGSLSEKIFVDINGVQQGMFIRGKDQTKPVLLFVHGGPSMPTYFLNQQYPTRLEEDFIVCWWEQRGGGLSYQPGADPTTISIEQTISDTLAVTNYLRRRFGQEKIYLLGHSWGSFIGIQAAAQAPELYHAYIGVSQEAYQIQSEVLAYDYMLAQFKQNGNQKMVRKLEAAPVTLQSVPLPDTYYALRDPAMHTLGIGTTRAMRSVEKDVFLATWRFPEYTLSEKYHLWRGRWSPYAKSMWNQMLATDLRVKVPRLEIPVYFFSGRYDYTVSYSLAKAYLEQLQAPVKGFYTFENSAHSPVYEEPEKTQQIIRQDVLAGQTSLADTK